MKIIKNHSQKLFFIFKVEQPKLKRSFQQILKWELAYTFDPRFINCEQTLKFHKKTKKPKKEEKISSIMEEKVGFGLYFYFCFKK